MDARSKKLLKQTVQKIIVGQGNRFIKELLRDKKLPIGSTKSDFTANLMQAIDDEALTVADVEAWLLEVEGWGNQHIYFYRSPEKLRSQVRPAIEASPHKDLLSAPSSLEFPDSLKLTTIDVQNDHVVFGWHRGNDRWINVPTKNYREEEDGDLWEYRAFRQRSNRTVVRFEWRFDAPFCTIMMQLPKEGSTHEDCIRNVWEVVTKSGITDQPTEPIPLSAAVNAFSAEHEGITATGRTMQAEGGHVDVVSSIPDRGIADIEALRAVSSAIDPTKFQSADGRFRLNSEQHTTISRPLGFEIAGSSGRVRIAVQCLRDDVRYLSDLIWQRNAGL